MQRRDGARVIRADFRRPSLRLKETAPRTLPGMVLRVCELADADTITASVMYRGNGAFEVVLGSGEPIPVQLLVMVRRIIAYLPCSESESHVVGLERTSLSWEPSAPSSENPDARIYTAQFEFGDRDPFGGHDCFAATQDGPCTVESVAIGFIRSDGTSAHPNKETSGIVLANRDYVPLAAIIAEKA